MIIIRSTACWCVRVRVVRSLHTLDCCKSFEFQPTRRRIGFPTRRSTRASRVIKHSASPNEGYNRLIRDRLGSLLLILELVLACVQHHCRLCGRLFCNNCCDNYLEVTVLDPLFAVRVCNKCYQDVRDTLRRRATAAANPASVWCILVLSLSLSLCIHSDDRCCCCCRSCSSDMYRKSHLHQAYLNTMASPLKKTKRWTLSARNPNSKTN